MGAMFLGEDLVVWLLLALGGALFVGNVMAMLRPPEQPREAADLRAAPMWRSLTMAVLGFVVAVIALGALVVG